MIHHPKHVITGIYSNLNSFNVTYTEWYIYNDFIFTDDLEELTSNHLLHRKSVASAFWAYQIENELTEENRRDYVFNRSQAQEKYVHGRSRHKESQFSVSS